MKAQISKLAAKMIVEDWDPDATNAVINDQMIALYDGENFEFGENLKMFYESREDKFYIQS